MDLLAATRQKLSALLRVVTSIRVDDYAQQHALDSADEIAKLLNETLTFLSALPPKTSKAAVRKYCQAVSQLLMDLLPMIGFLQRSQHSANPFEMYDPLLRIANNLFSPTKVKLVLSSTWDLSPYTYPMTATSFVGDVVLIGLPTSEAANALLIPLTGHEMGHSKWLHEDARQQYELAISARLYDVIKDRWSDFRKYYGAKGKVDQLFTTQNGLARIQGLVEDALLQCEEVFCDFLGLRLFGEGYLHALAYMLAPAWPGDRNPGYPSEKQRARYLIDAAKSAHISRPANYENLFAERAPTSSASSFSLELIDTVTADLAPSLWSHVDLLVGAKHEWPRDTVVKPIINDFQLGVPAREPASLAAIILAGWRVTASDDSWKDYPQITEKSWHLNELMLKSAEILEVNTRSKVGP